MASNVCARFPRRAIMFVLMFFGMACMSGSLNCMGFALTCMANQTRPARASLFDDCPLHIINTDEETGYEAEFDWSVKLQGYVLSSSCWGLALGCCLSWLPDKYGSKRIYLACGILTACIDLLCPVGTSNIWVLVALRILVGLGPAFNWTILMKVVEKWASVQEIGLVLGLTPAGVIAGPFLNVLVAGGICSTIGWRYIFYFWGFMTALWCIAWSLLFAEDHDSSRLLVSERELKWIQGGKKVRHFDSHRSIPWLKIFSSPQVWLIMYMGFSGGIYLYFLFGFIPTYLKTVLRLPSVYNGLVSALPLLMSIIGRFTAGMVVDRLRLSKTISTKAFSFIAMVLPAVFLVALSFMDCTKIPEAATLIALASLFSSCTAVGYMRAIVYMAPAYVSSVTMFSQVSGAVAGILVPIIIPQVLSTYALAQWKIAFYFVASVMSSAGVLYTIFGTAQQQKWGEEEEVLNVHEVVPLARQTSLVNG